MPVIRNLAVSVSARVTKFLAGMRKARGGLGQFAAMVAGAGLRLARFGAIAGIAAGVGLAVWMRSVMKSMDVTAKLAARINISTKALTGFQYAAEITGVGTETLNKSLGFLAKSLGEAASGTGEAKMALDAMGLSADQFLGKNPEEQVLMIADAFADLGTQEEKAFAASKLFGRGGLALVNLLDLGREGIVKLQMEAERLGITFDELAAQKIQDANDSLTRLGFLVRGVGIKLATEFAPVVTAAANQLVEMGTAGEGMGFKVVGAFRSIAVAITEVAGRLMRFRIIADILEDPFGASLEKVEAEITNMRASVDNFFAELDVKMRESHRLIAEGGGILGDATRKELTETESIAKKTLTTISSGIDVATIKAGNFRDALEKIGESLANMLLQAAQQKLLYSAFPDLFGTPSRETVVVPAVSANVINQGVQNDSGLQTVMNQIGQDNGTLQLVRQNGGMF